LLWWLGHSLRQVVDHCSKSRVDFMEVPCHGLG